MQGDGGGGDEGHITAFRVKSYREQQNEGPSQKSKVTKPPLEPITLIEGDLNEIGDKVCDTTTKLLRKFEQQNMYSSGTI